MSTGNITKKRKMVADGVFYAELNELFTRELGEEGYSGVEVRITPMRTEVIIRATNTQNVLGEKGQRIRELTWKSSRDLCFGQKNICAVYVSNGKITDAETDLVAGFELRSALKSGRDIISEGLTKMVNVQF